MNSKRVTIYYIAKKLELPASYIAESLNNHPSISEKAKEKDSVKKKVTELNYKHNSDRQSPILDSLFFCTVKKYCKQKKTGLSIRFFGD